MKKWKILQPIDSNEYFKSRVEKLYTKLNKKQSHRKVPKSLYISLKTPNGVQSKSFDNSTHLYYVEILNLFYSELLKDT